MIGLTALDGGSACKSSAAFRRPGEIAATAPDNPPNLISRRREMFPGLFVNILVSRGSLIPIPSRHNVTTATQPLRSLLETVRFSLQNRFREFREDSHSCFPPECHPQIPQRVGKFPDMIHSHPDPSRQRCSRTSGGRRGECSALPTSRALAAFPGCADIPQARS